jgi:transposase InsO family protein
MDERHDTPCGTAIKKLCERACEVFGQTEYTSLASISVSHLYNLRKSTAYVRQRRHFEKTQPKPSKIGERRKPQPNGQPGYIRIDTVHQGDLDKQKGVYHINAVDEVTQFEVVCTVEKISEIYLIPALDQLLETFPFTILGFHSDNGSEYINKRVAELLEKLRIEFTKSRSRHSNDNALAESKNGAVVRKLFGYSHIPQRWAPLINDFNQQHLNPYLNFHRPCFFPETQTDDKGKQRIQDDLARMRSCYRCRLAGKPVWMWVRLFTNATGLNRPFSIRSSNNTTWISCRRWKRKAGRYRAMCKTSSKPFSNVVAWSMVFYVYVAKNVSMSIWSLSVASGADFAPAVVPGGWRKAPLF